MKITRFPFHIDFILWLGVYFFALILILIPIISFSKGIVYPLDDVYIHLSMAKNLFQNGTWGLYPNENIAASSSPLYTLILSPFIYESSIASFAPLFLNIICSIAILWVFRLLINKLSLPITLHLFVGFLFIIIIPLPSLTVMGMEHLVHSLLNILVFYTIRFEEKRQWILPILIALSLFTRLETAFVICGIALWTLVEKRWDILLQLVIGFVAGIGLYLLLSIVFSINIIPNTVLLKSVINEQSWITYTLNKIWNSKLLLFVSLLSIVTLILRWKHSKLFLIVGVSTILHLIFARQGWFYRYETFLITLFFVVFIVDVLSDKNHQKYVQTIIVAGIFFVITSKRAYLSLSTTHIACKNIFDQQIQMAVMLFTLPNPTTIAVNDIGAVSYFTPHRFIDLYGIGTKEVYDLKRNKKFNATNLKKVIESSDTQIICVYTSWFDNSVFDGFYPTNTLLLENNVVCGSNVVTFFQNKKTTSKIPLSFP